MAIPYNLKSEEEVKEYLDNLHTEYRFGCYSEKNPEVCHILGEFKEAIKKDYPTACSLFKENCDERNFPKSCTKYGNYLLIGRGCEKNIKESYKYLRKGCDLGNDNGCVHAGVLAITNEKTELESDRAKQVDVGLKLLQKGCYEHNSDKACFFLAGIYLNGIKDLVEKNSKEAYKASLKSCEFGNPYACANIAQMHMRGDGVKQDSELAKIFKQRANMLENELKQSSPLNFQQGIQT